MTRVVFLNEWTRLRRSPGLIGVTIVTLVVLAATTWWSGQNEVAQGTAQRAAAERARADWLAQGDANPHGMAHFGDYVFRPGGTLSRIDTGVQASLGRVLRVEGHRRGTPMLPATSMAGPLARFGRFDPAFLLQGIVPLLLVFFGSVMAGGDHRDRRLHWMLSHGASGWSLVWGRSLHLWSIGLVCVAVVLSVALLHGHDASAPDAPARLIGLVVTHAIFLLLVAGFVTVITTVARSATFALVVLVGAWTVGTIVLPRVTATVASIAAPLPTRDAFETAMREARSQEVDGHDPEDVRLAEVEAELLAEYGVATKEELPINFDGIAMQVDEEVGNAVWDEHFGRLEERLLRQGRVGAVAALVNPVQSVRSLSMTLAGTDLAHDLAFQDAVEQYRRDLVWALNDEHAHGGSTTGDWSFEAEASFYAGLPPFDYEPVRLADVIPMRSLEATGLLLWACALPAVLLLAGRRLERGGVL